MALYKWDTLLAGIWAPEIPDWIVYLTQAEYDELSEEEKMDGTSYGIIWDSQDSSMMASLRRMVFWWWETDNLPLPNGSTIDIPSWCNIIYINWYWSNSSYWTTSYTVLFARWLPASQNIAHASWDYAWDRITINVDWDNMTVTFARAQSWNGSYAWATITFC